MKKLMIAATLVAFCGAVQADGITSANTVGYQSKTVAVNNRSMRSAATFLKVGENPTAIKISDIRQTSGDPGDLTLNTYNDNVTRIASYQFFSSEATGGELPEGWYVLDSNGDPDFEAGPQETALPYGQGCVIVSANSSAEYTSAGEVDSIKREFTVAVNARKMMGNVLPRTVNLSEIKQTTGDPGDLTFCTYNDNVTRIASYQFFSTETTGGELAEGWYILDSNGDPDFEAGPKSVEFASGAGFVIVSANSSAVLQFPKAIND